MKKILLFVSIFILIYGCSSSNNSTPAATRSFYMGFTPWLYAATAQAQTDVYNFINTDGDLVAHHLLQGIPYVTATDPSISNKLDLSVYPSKIQDEINGRISNTTSGKVIYLAIESLNSGRTDLIGLWDNNGEHQSLPSSWAGRSFDDPNVISAYVNFSIAVIEQFKARYGTLPQYFNYAPEVSELMINDSAKFSKFITFAQYVYSSLKATYPNLN